MVIKVFNDLIDDFTKSDFKSFGDDFEIFIIILKYGDLICDLIFKMSMKIKSKIITRYVCMYVCMYVCILVQSP
jgi:hypothetical protein